MSSPQRWPDALLAGLASAMRSASGPAVLAARGEVSGRPRAALLAAGAGEIIVDKSALAPDRIVAPSLIFRTCAGAYTGRAVAGAAGLLAGALGAGVGTYVTWRIRRLVVSATGLPDPIVAVGEDVIAYTLAGVATRPDRSPEGAV